MKREDIKYMAGRVTRGRFVGYKIYTDEGKQILYIKGNDELIELTPENVKQYRFTEKPSLLVDKLCYCIEWQDGSKSIIAIPSTQKSFLISGCEVGAVGDTSTPHWLSVLTGVVVFVGIMIVTICIIVVINAMSKKNSSKTDSDVGTWSEWEGTGTKPNADMLVQTTDTMAMSASSGVVSGYFYNNSKQTYRHLEAIYGVYDNAGNRLGKCTFSTNDVVLKPGGEQGFTATCNAWGNTPHIKLESVGFKTTKLN